jgi:hypothetical protein
MYLSNICGEFVVGRWLAHGQVQGSYSPLLAKYKHIQLGFCFHGPLYYVCIKLAQLDLTCIVSIMQVLWITDLTR